MREQAQLHASTDFKKYRAQAACAAGVVLTLYVMIEMQVVPGYVRDTATFAMLLACVLFGFLACGAVKNWREMRRA